MLCICLINLLSDFVLLYHVYVLGRLGIVLIGKQNGLKHTLYLILIVYGIVTLILCKVLK